MTSSSEDRVPEEGAGQAGLPAWLRLLRPHHWIKNGFVLLPVPFALAAGSRLEPASFAAGLFGFCLAASAVYAFNDLRDAEADRLNPRKRRRPVASGAVSEAGAALLAAGCAAAALGLAWAADRPGLVPLFGIYLGANLIYSVGAKDVPLLDVFILAAGFLLRVLVGCALVEATPSEWLLLCTSALALFLAFAKRRADLAEGMGPDHRPALAGYSVRFLDAAMGICAGIALVTYALYCGEAEVFREGRELASLPFVAFGIFDYLRLAYTRNAGANPVELALRQRSLQVCVALWLVAVAWGLGLL